VAFFWLFFSSFNSVYAQNTTNPFANSTYADIRDIAEWYIAQGGSIDDYFYSEGFSTGLDGQLGNEHICIRDDVNKVYVGRSDVCADRQMDGDGYSYIWVDKQDWSNGFPEDILLETGDVIGDSSINWSGCFNVFPNGTQIWAGTSGGQCPNMQEGGQINYGYVQQTLTNTAAINLALQQAGVEVTGYRYQWNVKNADANNETTNNPTSVDPFEVTVKVYNSAGQTVFEKTYDYSYWIDNWTTFSGEETFQNAYNADDLSEVQLSITGYDIGYWAGYYGPEFSGPEINLKYQMKGVPVVDPCDEVPVIDPTCPEFIGNAPAEDTAVKELVIIASTGSIPLSEDELAVLEALEDVSDTQQAIPEPPAVVVEEIEEETSNVDALSVARNAEASALAEADSTINNTLAATTFSLQSDIQQSQQTNQQAQQQAEQANQEALESAGFNLLSNDGNVSVSSVLSESQNLEKNQISIEIAVDSYEIAALDQAINDAVLNLIRLEQNIVREQVEESKQEEELTEPVSNEKEDELVAAALAGDDSEEAQAALLGFNPNFRAYQQPQMTDAEFYTPKEIYEGQKNYDNPNARFFNGASDATHREMVRQQYEGN
jgi:hypothetical protein